MYHIQVEVLTPPSTTRYFMSKDGKVLSFGEVIDLWQTDGGFVSAFVEQLRSSPYPAFRWETPPVTTSTLGRPFECVLLNCPSLRRRVDGGAFKEHFSTDEAVVSFMNLGEDARLVVPCPQWDNSHYGHLASFLRGAPERQVLDLFGRVGKEMAARVSAKPVWLSTAGMGVSWVHVRLDDEPKYYGYEPYRRPPGGR